MKNITKQRLYLEAGFKCMNPTCNHAYPQHNLQIHHIVKKADLGTDEIENLIVLCGQCHYDLHLAGTVARQHLYQWKRWANANIQHSNTHLAMREYLMFGMEDDKRRYRNLSIVRQVSGFLSLPSFEESGLVSLHLLHGLAFACHRMGASDVSISALETLIGNGDFKLLPLEAQVKIQQLLCRALTQNGDLDIASAMLGKLIKFSEHTGIYEGYLSLAEMYADMLNIFARTLDRNNFEWALDGARSRLAGNRSLSARFAQTTKSRILLYDGLFHALRGRENAGEQSIFDSLNLTSLKSRRGQSIRLGLLGKYYLRLFFKTLGFPKKKEHLFNQAYEAFKKSLTTVQFPNESSIYVTSCLGLAVCHMARNDLEKVKLYADRARQTANVFGLPYDSHLEELVIYCEFDPSYLRGYSGSAAQQA